jgi:CBS domain-containing protein
MNALQLSPLGHDELAIPGADPWFASPGDPATSVMTDFRERASVTLNDADKVDAALEHMKHAGVRCAFVVNGAARVVGLITAYDILSEKPTLQAQLAGTARADVQVREIMTNMADCRVIDIRLLEQSRVADVHQLFLESRLTHIPVMETGEANEQRLRGLLSASKVRRLLGL